MTFLIAAVILVGALCVVDLLLTFAVLRRLREQATELDRLGSTPPEPFGFDPAALVGRSLPEPVVTHLPRLVGVFDANCPTCFEHAPRFAAQAGTQTLVAVVSGTGPRVDELVGLLADVPTIVGEDASQVVTELEIQAFPTFLRAAQDGTVMQAHAGPMSDWQEPAIP
jgi:hypothetical protein